MGRSGRLRRDLVEAGAVRGRVAGEVDELARCRGLLAEPDSDLLERGDRGGHRLDRVRLERLLVRDGVTRQLLAGEDAVGVAGEGTVLRFDTEDLARVAGELV